MPWETHEKITRPPKGYVKWYEWAYRPEGVKQVGCIYTAQGFEFDYIGVIIGDDLIYDEKTDSLNGDITATQDPALKKSPESFETHVRNIYRVLLTRGMRGCCVYFVNKETEKYFRSRIEKATNLLPFPVQISTEIEEKKKYQEYLPVYSLKAAAGKFGDGMNVQEEGWIKADIGRKLSNRMFVVKVIGHSMEPLIPDDSYCIFSQYAGGSRHGKVVLVQHRRIADMETGGSYTVKKYSSEKQFEKDGTWKHEKIILDPINNKFDPIIIPPTDADDFKVIGELVAVL